MDRSLIDQFAAGADAPARAIAGLTDAQLSARPVAGTWSIREIVVHLMDSDAVAVDRMKRIIAEDKPLLMGYNQDAFAQRLRYNDIDPARACEIFRLNRLLLADILRKLPDEDFERVGIHSERGKVTLGQLVGDYVGHLRHHLEHLQQKRSRV